MASVAIRLARALAPFPHVLASIEKAGGILVIDVDEFDTSALGLAMTDLMESVGRHMASADEIDFAINRQPNGHFALLLEPIERKQKSSFGNMTRQARGAIHAGVAIVAMSCSSSGALPECVLSRADLFISLPPLTGRDLGLLIEHVTGERVSGFASDTLAAHVQSKDLLDHVVAGARAETVLEDLKAAVSRRTRQEERLPSLEDVAGDDAELCRVLHAIAADLTALRKGAVTWPEMAYRGLLLHGQPGTGKTLAMHCMAKAAGVPLIEGSLAQFQAADEGHLGTTLKAMRQSFQQALDSAPAIWGIDEIDSFGDRDTHDGTARSYQRQVVNCLLEILDGASKREGVFVMAAANSLTHIDPAILRSGRLDAAVTMKPPTPGSLARVMRFHLGDSLPDADLTTIAGTAFGSPTPADVAAWVRRAFGRARRECRDLIEADLLREAQGNMGPIPGHLIHRVAVHEAGHVVVAAALGLQTAQDVSIQPHGGLARLYGEAWTAMTRREALSQIAIHLAGRAAEQVVCGAVSAAAASDLEKATVLACAMEGSWGLGTFSHVWLAPEERWRGKGETYVLAARIQPTIDSVYAETLRIIDANLPALTALSDRLAQKRYLPGDEVRALISTLVVPAKIAAALDAA